MSQERLVELKDLLFNVERKIRPLEWDAGRNQINPFKKLELTRLKTEYETLQTELKALEIQQTVSLIKE